MRRFVAALVAAPLILGACGSDDAAGQPGPEMDASLLAAASRGDVEDVRNALAGGANVDARDEGGATALLVATHANHVSVARLLIERGADVNAKDRIQDSPYLYAAAEGRLEILRLTLANGADLKSTNRFGGTGLIPAAHHGHVDVVRELLQTPIDINHVNNLGWTALLEAVILGDGGEAHTAIVGLLTGAGADVNLPDRQGVTPLQHARARGFTRIGELLEAAGGR